MNPLRATIDHLLAQQSEHRAFAKYAVDWEAEAPEGECWVHLAAGRRECWTFAFLIEAVKAREERIELEALDPFANGTWPMAWHELLWEVCALRVRNPGVPITYGIFGANGSGKTQMCAAAVIRAMAHAPLAHNRLYWAYAMDEPNSETVQQAALYYWLPGGYKTDTGAVKTTARTKLRFNTSGGFTDNRFGLDNGARMECRFWSKDPTSLEGPRPYTVWSDEEIPLLWMDGIERRLLTHAEATTAHIAEWEALLMRRISEPDLRFPLELLWKLLQGVHLVSVTFKSGYTETVAAFMEGAKIMREIDATLLTLTDKRSGEALGFERVPKLIQCAEKKRAAGFLHAWDNPWGGNWTAMQDIARTKTRGYILWWCYGVAEKIGESPFPHFNPQVHVRPVTWIEGMRGTWYHIVDPVASGGRAWFQIWAFVCGEVRGHLRPGDIFVAMEWPCETWHVQDVGYMGEWATTGGKKGLGVRGSAQSALGWGYRRQKEEIERIEQHLYTLHSRGSRTQGAGRIRVRDDCRIMDSRAANTEKENESYSKTLIEWMEEDSPGTTDGLSFLPAGRDSGAAQGQTRVQPGEQMINDRLYYDKEKAILDPATGWIAVPPSEGRGPSLYIADHCTNLIAALRHYPGGQSGDSAFKDPIDCLRYLVIADPQDLSRSVASVRASVENRNRAAASQFTIS